MFAVSVVICQSSIPLSPALVKYYRTATNAVVIDVTIPVTENVTGMV